MRIQLEVRVLRVQLEVEDESELLSPWRVYTEHPGRLLASSIAEMLSGRRRVAAVPTPKPEPGT